jgi:uncharacterized membrane protein YjjP (DUF1212 family)
MRNLFSSLRRVVWAAVFAVGFCAAGFFFAIRGDELLTLAAGLTSGTLALLSLRASR